MFHRDAVAAGFGCEAGAGHRRRRFHRLYLVDAWSPAAPRSSSTTTSRTGRREFVAARRRALRRGRRARPHALTAALAAATGLPPAGERRRPPRARAPARDLEQNTLATSAVLEAMRATGQADRLLLDRFGLRRARGLPDPRGRPFPVQTSLYGASKLAAEGLIAAYATATASPRGLPLRLGAGRALHPRPRLRLLARAALRSDAPAGAGRRPAAQELHVHGDCVGGDPARLSPPRAARRLQPRAPRDGDRRRLDRADHRAHRSQARSSTTRAARAAGRAIPR